jgi:DNA (cytosine-5)-methyltransferase 1
MVFCGWTRTNKVPRKLSAVGCHIYAGGFAIGVREHFNVLAHFEEWNFGVETVRNNLKIPVHVGTPDSWPADEYKPDFIFNNPPCAPWSNANSHGGMHWRTDPRKVHWENCYTLLERMQPDVWACESVRGIYRNGLEFINDFVMKARRKGYGATHLLVNALEHGIPQQRKRYLLVLHRVELDWKPTGLEKTATVADMWKGGRFSKEMKVHSSKFLTPKVIRAMKPGDMANKVWDRFNPNVVYNEEGKRKGRPSCFIRRLDLTKQSPVIAGRGEFVHPTEHRFLSVEEQARLCGFPWGYQFTGPINVKFQQIGKGVCPHVGGYVAKMAAHGIRRGRKVLSLAPRQIEIFRDKVEITEL